MCEILVKAVDHVHPDPEKDRRGAYKQGMFVLAKPDGHSWGFEEGLPKFWKIKIPGVAVADIESYCQAEILGEEVYRRREWGVRYSKLPKPLQKKLDENGEITVTIGQFSAYKKRAGDL